MPTHHLPAEQATATQVLSRATPPVLRIEPGDRVVVESLDAWGHLERQASPGAVTPYRFPDRRGHALTGPIEIAGTVPGDVLALRFEAFETAGWGWTAAGRLDDAFAHSLGLAGTDPAWLLWELDRDTMTGTNQYGQSVRLDPFLGVVGLPPAEPGEHSTTPPRAAGGGNIDCRELTAGSTLFLPVTVPGALLHLGDGHAAQGDGEVGGTAIECGMTTTLTVDVVRDAPLTGIHALTPSARITFGFDADLNRATAEALGAMLTWLQRLYGLERKTALALASSVVDLRVTQIANRTWGVHAVLGLDAVGRA
ncbi:acetamidase/formamidase family protein [Arthrobacter agilis]|uniref:acetamidase/formamidase family protein n=1 Tax=Arthrobacter agilis TaxID=37921 RepID=UPI0023663F04|nr:acetamidase/formamidase family protein [Arthrobacter agilis]WDF32182.1 acetamidase/formamidase family protein [Arthrobacter agilis]